MTTLEFTQKYGYIWNLKNNIFDLIELFDYQHDLLNDFTHRRFISLEHSRQMGVTSLLTFHMTNFLINNIDSNKILLFKTSKIDIGKEIIFRVKELIDIYSYYEKIECLYEKYDKYSITMNNGNKIIIKSSPYNIDFNNINTLIVDNAAWCDDLNIYLNNAIFNNVKQIILASARNGSQDNYFNSMHNMSENNFHKIKLNWFLNPQHTTEWYNNQKKLFGESTEAFANEIELVSYVPSPVKENTKVINFRLGESTYLEISRKLMQLDINLSEYLRNLIDDDLNKPTNS